MMMKKRALAAITLTLSVSLACSKKKEDDKDDDESTTGSVVSGGGGKTAASTTTGNALADVFPLELGFTAFPKTAGATLALQEEPATKADDAAATAPAEESADLPPAEKAEAHQEKIAGTGECFHADEFREQGDHIPVTCYEFDSDMNPHKVDGNDREFGTVDGTNGEGEACMVTFARQEMQRVSRRVDRAMATISGLLCKAKKGGLSGELPAVDETLDLAAAVADVTAIKFSKATISRLADVGGAAVYRTDLAIADADGNEDEIHLIHSPSADGGSSGTLWIKRAPRATALPDGGVDPNNTSEKNDVMSINYTKSIVEGRSRMTAELRRASIATSIEPFNANGLVAYENLPEVAQNSTVHAIKYVAFDMYTDTAEGSLSYWMNPGGNYVESARGFLFSMVRNESGLLEGCGTSGATRDVSIRAAVTAPSETNVLKPVRFWHPQANKNVHPDKDSRYDAGEGNLVTYQCFSQDETGVYAIDAEMIDDVRGYEVIEGADTGVSPPPPPSKVLEGDFKPVE